MLENSSSQGNPERVYRKLLNTTTTKTFLKIPIKYKTLWDKEEAWFADGLCMGIAKYQDHCPKQHINVICGLVDKDKENITNNESYL